MLLICLPQEADTQSNLFSVKEALEIYLASCVLPCLALPCPPPPPRSQCVYVCMFLSSPSFPRKGEQDL